MTSTAAAFTTPACMSAETGVGAARVEGNQRWNGSCVERANAATAVVVQHDVFALDPALVGELNCYARAQERQFAQTMLKRRRPIPDVDSTNPSRRSLAERLAINSVVQGSAA